MKSKPNGARRLIELSGIAARNLMRQKRRAILLGSAIAFGVLIVTMVNAFSSGTVRILKENIADLVGGHVFITLEQRTNNKTVSVIEDDSKLLAALHEVGIKDSQIAKTVSVVGTIHYQSRSVLLQIIGVDWNHAPATIEKLGLSPDVVEQLKKDEQGLVLNRKTANKLKAVLGDQNLDYTCDTLLGQPNAGSLNIAWVTDDSSEFADSYAFASSSYVNMLLDLGNSSAYRTLRIKLGSLEEATPMAEKIKKALAAYYPVAADEQNNFNMATEVFKMGDDSVDFTGQQARVQTVNDFISQLTTFSDGLQIASYVLLVFLLLIIMIGIANTFRMILFERTIEIGTLRALGMQKPDVQNLFLLEALFLALGGVLLGVAVSALAMFVLGFFHFDTTTAFAIALSNGHLVFRIEILNVVVSILLVSIFTLIAALGPSRKAARVAPAVALRANF